MISSKLWALNCEHNVYYYLQFLWIIFELETLRRSWLIADYVQNQFLYLYNKDKNDTTFKGEKNQIMQMSYEEILVEKERNTYSTVWCCLSWWAYSGSYGCKNGNLHGWFVAVHTNHVVMFQAITPGTWQLGRFPSSHVWLLSRNVPALHQADSSTIYFFRPSFSTDKRCVHTQETWSGFHCVCRVIEVSLD